MRQQKTRLQIDMDLLRGEVEIARQRKREEFIFRALKVYLLAGATLGFVAFAMALGALIAIAAGHR